MNDRWFSRYDPASASAAANAPGHNHSAPQDRPSEDTAAEEHWSVAARLIFMIGAAILCWAILGAAIYFLV